MSGGAGYVLSREAVRRFKEGQEKSCRPGDLGPEDVEMSRCLQRLGASFIDTRDSEGRWGEKYHHLLHSTIVGPGSIMSHQRTHSISRKTFNGLTWVGSENTLLSRYSI